MTVYRHSYQQEETAMSKFVTNLKHQAEANPIVAIAVGVAVVTAASKFMDANTARMAAKTHAKEVARRVTLVR